MFKASAIYGITARAIANFYFFLDCCDVVALNFAHFVHDGSVSTLSSLLVGKCCSDNKSLFFVLSF